MLLYFSSSCGINESEHLRIDQYNWDTTRYMDREANASSEAEGNILAKRARNKSETALRSISVDPEQTAPIGAV